VGMFDIADPLRGSTAALVIFFSSQLSAFVGSSKISCASKVLTKFLTFFLKLRIAEGHALGVELAILIVRIEEFLEGVVE